MVTDLCDDRPVTTPDPSTARGVPGIRERNRAAIEAEILTVARRHLAADGAAALSLRAVARDLGMVPSALYRYVASRDDLLTLLIIDAYDALGDAVDAALGALPQDSSVRVRFTTIATTLRTWARGHVPQYALLYGSPVPDYDAPAERTQGPGVRVYLALLTLLAQAPSAPALRGLDAPVQAAGSGSLEPLLADPELAGFALAPETLLRGLAAWHLVSGAVTSEVFEQLGPDVSSDPDAMFAALADLAASLFTGRPG